MYTCRRRSRSWALSAFWQAYIWFLTFVIASSIAREFFSLMTAGCPAPRPCSPHVRLTRTLDEPQG
jgi:hypothetical protein